MDDDQGGGGQMVPLQKVMQMIMPLVAQMHGGQKPGGAPQGGGPQQALAPAPFSQSPSSQGGGQPGGGQGPAPPSGPAGQGQTMGAPQLPQPGGLEQAPFGGSGHPAGASPSNSYADFSKVNKMP